MDDKPWIKNYPAGVRWDITIEPGPVQQMLENAARRWPDKAAIEFMGRTFNYSEYKSLTDRVAVGLQKLGVGPGVHVGLFLPNTPHYPIAFFGVLKAGGTVVNYSPLDAAKVLAHKIEDSRTDVLITLDLDVLYPQMAAMLGKTRLKKLVVGSLAEMTPAPEATAAALRKAGQLAEVVAHEAQLSFAELIDNDGRHVVHPVADPADEVAVLQYTGGTTGLPKGAMLTHANLWSACAQTFETCSGSKPVLLEGQETVLAVLPPFHIYSLTINSLFGVLLGAETILHTRFDPKAALEAITNRKVTLFPGVPTMFTALINHPEIANYSLRSLKYCASAGAPLPADIANRFKEITGCPLIEGWGMTETSPVGTFTPVHGMRKVGSCGMPVPRVTVKMLDLEDSSKYVARGERGEICVHGPNVMKGYWNNPDATRDATTFDGFFRTGDVGYMDPDGYVFLVDRTKDMILCSGFNVYPRNLEEAIYTHPSVREVSVIGIDDAYRGQSPKAFIALKEGAPRFTLEELQAFLKDKLAKYEMVQALDIRDELPKTPVGKLSKKELYEEEKEKARRAGA